jgi:hypothetical protein
MKKTGHEKSRDTVPLSVFELFSLLFIFSSAAPQRTAYSEVPSQMAAHLKTGSPLYM